MSEEFLKKLTNFRLADEYANKTIKTSDGKHGYVTRNGVVKPYADANMSARCPHEVVNVAKTWSELNFPIGSMMVPDQSCGNEGKYVQSFPSQNTTVADFSSIGKVGYVDLDTRLHPIGAVNYLQQYRSVAQKIKGPAMVSCSKKLTPVKYLDTVYFATRNTTGNLIGFMNNLSILEFNLNLTSGFIVKPTPDIRDAHMKYGDKVIISNGNLKKAFLNEATKLMEFGSSESVFYFQAPVGSTYRAGDPILYGNQIILTVTPQSESTNACAWYGCRVGSLNPFNQLQFDKGTTTGSTFTIQNSPQPSIYSEACKVDELTEDCNLDTKCIGFIFASKTNEWQKLTKDTQFMESSDPTTVFIKQATVQLADTSCIPGTVLPIDSSLYNHYPQGPSILSDGSGQCDVRLGMSDQSMVSAQDIVKRQMQSFSDQQTKVSNSSKHLLKEYDTLHADTETKIKEYNKLDLELERRTPEDDSTLKQQQKDNEIIRRQNQFKSFIWSLIIVGVVGIIVI